MPAMFRRILLATDGRLGVFTAKTAASLLRYRAQDIVGVVDAAAAGRSLPSIIPWAAEVPIIADLNAAMTLCPDALFIGVAPRGGEISATLVDLCREALERGVSVVSGLHDRLSDIAALAAAARATGAQIVEVRTAPAQRTVASCLAVATRCRRVLTVGSDCNVGKMVTALELTSAARRRGHRAEFVATGQTGIMISGWGVPVDAVVSDFAAGAIEDAVLRVADCDVCFIEGQGSVAHCGYGAVTLATIQGACPDALILVHHAGRTHYVHPPHAALPALAWLRNLYERTTESVLSARVVGVALNTFGCAAATAERLAAEIRAELGTPVVDPIREGVEPLLDGLCLQRGAGGQ